MSTNQHKTPKFSTMTGKEDPQPFEQCLPIQDKTINIASTQLINILLGKVNTPRKQLTFPRPQPACSHKSLSHCCHHVIFIIMLIVVADHLMNKYSEDVAVLSLILLYWCS